MRKSSLFWLFWININIGITQPLISYGMAASTVKVKKYEYIGYCYFWNKKQAHIYWKGSSWKLECVFRYIRYIGFSLIVSIGNLQRSLTQLVSTSNKRSSSGEMKKDPKRVGIYRGSGLDTCFGQRWTVEANLHTFYRRLINLWSVSCVECGKLLQLSLTHVNILPHLFTPFGGVWRWRNDITQFMSGDKELGLVWKYVANSSINLRINWAGF